MSEFAYWLGFFVMGLSSLAACVLLAGLLADFAWSQIIKVRGIAWVGKAMRHYSKIEAPPNRDAV